MLFCCSVHEAAAEVNRIHTVDAVSDSVYYNVSIFFSAMFAFKWVHLWIIIAKHNKKPLSTLTTLSFKDNTACTWFEEVVV